MLFDVIDIEEYVKEEKKRQETFNREKKLGTPKSPEKVKLFNKHNQKYGIENISSIEFDKYHDYYDRDVEEVNYIIECTIYFCKEVFEIDLDTSEAANISCEMFRVYCEESDLKIDRRIELYRLAKNVLLKVDTFKSKSLEKAEDVLQKLNVEIPIEIKLAKKIKQKYAKNQRKKALSTLLTQIFPEISTKFIIDKISTKVLSADNSHN